MGSYYTCLGIKKKRKKIVKQIPLQDTLFWKPLKNTIAEYTVLTALKEVSINSTCIWIRIKRIIHNWYNSRLLSTKEYNLFRINYHTSLQYCHKFTPSYLVASRGGGRRRHRGQALSQHAAWLRWVLPFPHSWREPTEPLVCRVLRPGKLSSEVSFFVLLLFFFFLFLRLLLLLFWRFIFYFFFFYYYFFFGVLSCFS